MDNDLEKNVSDSAAPVSPAADTYGVDDDAPVVPVPRRRRHRAGAVGVPESDAAGGGDGTDALSKADMLEYGDESSAADADVFIPTDAPVTTDDHDVPDDVPVRFAMPEDVVTDEPAVKRRSQVAGKEVKRAAGSANGKPSTAKRTKKAHKTPSGAAAKKTGAQGVQGKPRTQAARAKSRAQLREKWIAPMCVVCALMLCTLGAFGVNQVIKYSEYRNKVEAIGKNTFYEGSSFEGYPLSGMTLEQATVAANSLMQNVAENAGITVVAGDETFIVDKDDIGMSIDAVNLLASNYAKYRNGSLEERYQKVQTLKATGENLTLNRGWSESALRGRIGEIADAVYVEFRNAGVAEFNVDSGKGSFVFSKEQTGVELDKDDLYQKLTAAITEGNVNGTVNAKLNILEPKYDVAYMKENFGCISKASTNTTSNTDRNRNIKLASSTFNGKVIMPGETFSFNGCTGERTPGKGYREAGAYSGGVTVKEPGGGVCQVSTTLYQAVCKADLEIVERSPHSRPSSYTAKGLDAAVSWPGQDFKFRNDTDFPIFLTSNFYDCTITIRVYGHYLPNGMSISLTSKVIEEINPGTRVEKMNDSSIPRGETRTERARTGYRVVSYKVYKDSDGDRIKSEKLDNSYYDSSNEILRIGTGS